MRFVRLERLYPTNQIGNVCIMFWVERIISVFPSVRNKSHGVTCCGVELPHIIVVSVHRVERNGDSIFCTGQIRFHCIVHRCSAESGGFDSDQFVNSGGVVFSAELSVDNRTGSKWIDAVIKIIVFYIFSGRIYQFDVVKEAIFFVATVRAETYFSDFTGKAHSSQLRGQRDIGRSRIVVKISSDRILIDNQLYMLSIR